MRSCLTVFRIFRWTLSHDDRSFSFYGRGEYENEVPNPLQCTILRNTCPETCHGGPPRILFSIVRNCKRARCCGRVRVLIEFSFSEWRKSSEWLEVCLAMGAVQVEQIVLLFRQRRCTSCWDVDNCFLC